MVILICFYHIPFCNVWCLLYFVFLFLSIQSLGLSYEMCYMNKWLDLTCLDLTWLDLTVIYPIHFTKLWIQLKSERVGKLASKKHSSYCNFLEHTLFIHSHVGLIMIMIWHVTYFQFSMKHLAHLAEQIIDIVQKRSSYSGLYIVISESEYQWFIWLWAGQSPQHHVKWYPLLMTVADDHSWISYQSVLTAVKAFDKCLSAN